MTSQVLAPPPPEIRRGDSTPSEAVTRSRPVISSPRPRRGLAIGRGPLAVSLLVHAGAVGVMLFLLRFGPTLERPARVAAPESVEYIDLAWPTGVPGDGAGVESSPPTAESPAPNEQPAPRRQPDAGPLVFPGRVPTGIAPPASSAVGDGGAGGGGASSAGGVGERLRPGFRDSRLYVTPGAPIAQAEQTNHQKYMEHLTARIEASNDSVAAGARTPNTDWTVRDGSGRRWGLSEEGLHLGPITVPNALVPKPASTGSNQKQEEARTEQQQRDEIRRQEEERARREAREESIRKARERADAAR